MALLTILSLVVMAMAGVLAHELAHWAVWQVAGRRPELDLFKLEVRPCAGPMETTVGDRVAAAAPYAVGALVAVLGWYSGAVTVVVFGAAMIQIPSAVDVATMRGDTHWRVSG